MESQTPHSQDRVTHLSLTAILSVTSQNPSTPVIYSNFSACYTYMMKHLYLKIKYTLKHFYSLYAITLPSLDCKFTLAADPNLLKFNAYSFPHLDYSNPQIILIPQLTSTPPILPYLQRKKIRNKRNKGRTKHMNSQMI